MSLNTFADDIGSVAATIEPPKSLPAPTPTPTPVISSSNSDPIASYQEVDVSKEPHTWFVQAFYVRDFGRNDVEYYQIIWSKRTNEFWWRETNKLGTPLENTAYGPYKTIARAFQGLVYWGGGISKDYERLS